ncbi:MAG: cation:proton antiporter [Flavobacteriales bacterium]|jgi:Kef-type K+ transport system membrane component KefB|nr:cation:proton antiporter [Flavobacteriales bacterium]
MANSFFQHLSTEFQLPLQNPVLVFCVVLFIILLAPLILRQFKVPGVIGLIISGVIVGPHALNLLEKNSAVDLFSTIGLLYIMFIAGLELDMDEFRKHRNKSLWFGLFTFAIPLAIGYPACRYLLGFSEGASFLTAIMFSTHTLVAYPIVSKFGIGRQQAVAVAVGGTILTDTAVLLVFAVLMGAETGGLTQEFWIRLSTSMAIFLLFMFAVLPRIARWFFSRLESEKTSHYIFVLAAVFFAAFLAQVAGVEPIIGAFVAGLALNRLIPASSVLMNRLEFVGNALFIPFFLISVGMVVDVRVLTRGTDALVVAGVLTVVALVGKWLAAFTTQMVFRYNSAQRQLIFGLSSAHAAATLAIILVGYKAGIIDEAILNGTIILILITSLVASFATEAAARRIVRTGEVDVQPGAVAEPVRERILIPCAEPASVPPLLDLATLLRTHQKPQPITLVTVVENDDRATQRAQRMQRLLSDQARYAAGSDLPVNTVVTIDNNVAGGIIRTAKETGSNVILLGWSDRVTLLERLFGPKTDTLLRNYHQLVLVTRITRPLPAHRRLLLVCPPLAEREPGFVQWVDKVQRMAKELGLRSEVLAEPTTHDALLAVLAGQRSTFAPVLVPLEEDVELEDRLARHAQPNDLVVLVSARPRSISHQIALDQLPRRLDKQFQELSLIMVYPATEALPEDILELT